MSPQQVLAESYILSGSMSCIDMHEHVNVSLHRPARPHLPRQTLIWQKRSADDMQLAWSVTISATVSHAHALTLSMHTPMSIFTSTTSILLSMKQVIIA